MAPRSASATSRACGTRLAEIEDAVTARLLAEMRHDRGDAGLAHRDVLLAVAARGRDRADALPVDEDREAADEDREAAVMLGHDAERFLARHRVLVIVGRLAM